MNSVWRSHWVVAAVVAAILTVAHTWPLASAPGTWSRNDNGDTMLNEWIIAWVQHQLATHPLALFQGNIFYPARDTLAFSEPLIVPAIVGAPARAAGGSPVLVHNLVLLAGLMLSTLGMYALVYEWTRDRSAALLAGSVFAFNAHTLTRLAHVQAMHAYALPLALLAADRILTGGRGRNVIWLAVWMTAAAYTSGHFAIFSFTVIAIAILVRFTEWRHAPVVTLGRFAAAAGLSAVAIVPLWWPYRRAAAEQGMVRTLDHVREFSATLWSYAASGSIVHQALWSDRFQGIDAYFPGGLVLALALFGIVYGWRTRATSGDGPATRGRVKMLVAIGLAGVVLSLGTNTPVYGWLYRAFPPMNAIRAASRFGTLFLLAMAALAGCGLWQLRRRVHRPGLAAAIGTIAVVLVNVEACRAPIAYREFRGLPGLYTMLASEPGPVVLAEMPFYRPDAVFMNAEYVLNSTVHWRPLLNGYSGYLPGTYEQHAREFADFPAAVAIDAMRRAGVTHVMVHPSRYSHGDVIMQLCSASPSLERLGTGRDGMTLFRLK
jgi:hypothetical protein